MDIIVSIKQVPDTGQVKIDPETGHLIREGVPSIINPEDKNAIEEAVRLKEQNGGKITVITMGPKQAEEALREAMINAVAHRDYTTHGPIRLFILDDRIEIHTPGKAPNTVDEEAMRAGIHVVRNPHIYGRLSDAGLVTRAGSGIRRMIRLIKEATVNDIGIDLINFEVLITIPRKKRAE